MDLNYTAVDTFQAVHQDKNKYIFIRGPVGSGKSSGCIWHCVLNAFKQRVQYDNVRRARYAILRATYPALKTTVVKSWKNWFKNLVNIVYDTPIRGALRLPHPDKETTVEIELVFIALDRDEDVNKLQSLELTGAHMNETAEIPRGVHQMLKSRINRFPDSADGGAVDPFIICDYNSVPTDHWLYKIAEEDKPLKHSFYDQPSALTMVEAFPDCQIYDTAQNCYKINPEADNLGHHVYGPRNDPPTTLSVWDKKVGMWWVPHLDEDYYVDQVLGADPDWVNVMILNNYGELRTGKPVYPQYLDHIHYNQNLSGPMKGVPIIIGVDLGLTPAAAFTQLSPMGEFLVFDEIVTEDCSIREFCNEHLKPKLANEYSGYRVEIIVDPAVTQRSQNDKKSAGEILKDCGIPFRPARTNSQLKRKEAVVYFLKRVQGFRIGVNAPFLRKGLISEFKYPKKQTAVANVRSSDSDMYHDKWLKNIYSHVQEGLQYAALELSEGRSSKKKRRNSSNSNQHNGPADADAGY